MVAGMTLAALSFVAAGFLQIPIAVSCSLFLCLCDMCNCVCHFIVRVDCFAHGLRLTTRLAWEITRTNRRKPGCLA